MKTHLLAVHSSTRCLGTISVLDDNPKVPLKWQGRVERGTGVLTFWRGWHLSTIIKFYKRLGWRITAADQAPE